MARCEYLRAYTQQKSNANRRGLQMVMSFEEWKSVWVESGKWEDRGRGSQKYCMCRKNDEGNYELGNVYIGLGKDNVRDGNLGKLVSEATKAKISQSNSGRSNDYAKGEKNVMHRPEVKAKISAAVGGSNNYRAKTVVSPFGRFGSTTEASKELGIPAVTIQWRCRHNKNGWSYLQSTDTGDFQSCQNIV